MLYAVAGNPKTPLEVLTKLAGVANFTVREAVAKPPSTPDEILMFVLMLDKDEYVSKATRDEFNRREQVQTQQEGVSA